MKQMMSIHSEVKIHTKNNKTTDIKGKQYLIVDVLMKYDELLCFSPSKKNH